jgi:outer membrane protein OmpA-like peptidoglycan-associated protein
MHFRKTSTGEDWISLSDVMTGLMLVFLLIAVAFMRQERLKADEIRVQKKAIEEIAVEFRDRQDSLYAELASTFGDSLNSWNARVTRPDTLSVIFESPEVLFEAGKATLRPRFKEILQVFWPRFVEVLRKDGFRDHIDEIRIEGHTSSEWIGKDYWSAYFKNMELSQKRTRAVLRYVLSHGANREGLLWQQSLVTANGLSSSKPIKLPDKTEDVAASRRVEFRVRTSATRQVRKIINELLIQP